MSHKKITTLAEDIQDLSLFMPAAANSISSLLALDNLDKEIIAAYLDNREGQAFSNSVNGGLQEVLTAVPAQRAAGVDRNPGRTPLPTPLHRRVGGAPTAAKVPLRSKTNVTGVAPAKPLSAVKEGVAQALKRYAARLSESKGK